MDDQLARCKVAEKEGWGIVVEKRDAKSIHQAIQRIVELETENSSTRQDERDLTWVSKLIQTPRGS
jgi:hypothetical protein